MVNFLSMRTVFVTVLVALLIVCAGCASPEETEEGGDPPVEETTSVTDNDFGAEPVNPNVSNGTESGATANPATDEQGSGNGTTGDEVSPATVESNATETNESADVALGLVPVRAR